MFPIPDQYRLFPPKPPKSSGDKSCFIATAACGTEHAEDVIRLRAYRDIVLRRTLLGRIFISMYECLSPPLARSIAHSTRRRLWVRRLIVYPARFIADLCLCSKSKKLDSGVSP